MEELFTHAGIAEIDTKTRQHFKDLGWFLSVSERIAGYALGNFEHAMILARTNAHALGWHPSRIYEESVRYFSILKEERRMFEYVLQGIPYEYRKTFFDNIAAFKNIWAKEIDIRDSIRKSKITLIPVVEENENENDSRTHPLVHNTADSILKIFRELHVPVDINNEARFRKSLNWSDTILVTLRVKDAHKLRMMRILEKEILHIWNGLESKQAFGEKMVVIFLDLSFSKRQNGKAIPMCQAMFIEML
jgi:hypothetical protein